MESLAMKDPVRIFRLANTGDGRGDSFVPPPECLEFVGAVRDMHLATIRPGAVRGNHYHRHHCEVIIVVHADRWSFHWDSGSGSEVQSETFSGAGAVMLQVEPLAGHAVRNDGQRELHLMSISNLPYDPQKPDSQPRRIV